MRIVVLAVILALTSGPAYAEENISAEALGAVKQATVFIQVKSSSWQGSGSGFVVSRGKDTAWIATNYHVLSGPKYDRKSRPSEIQKLLKDATVTVVLESGTKAERSIKAEPLAADAETDLAILQVSGLKEIPKELAYKPLKLIETMPIYTFGFPFGKALSTTKEAAPAVTIGKGAISSLRNRDNGELEVIQIDGSLNPGNSGGPIVDAKGHLVGVAVATIRDGHGIGFVIPAVELDRVMSGKLGGFQVAARKQADAGPSVRVEVGAIDPGKTIRSATLHYLTLGSKAPQPAIENLAKHPGVRSVQLKIEGGVATGEVPVKAEDGDLLLQAVPEGGSAFGTGIKRFTIAGAAAADPDRPALAANGKPPAGWKEFTPKDNAFTVWIPEKTVRQSERERTVNSRGQRIRSTILHVELPAGLSYQVERLTLPLGLHARMRRKDLEELLQELLVAEFKGKLKQQNDAKMGAFSGKEYLIETPDGLARARVFIFGSRVYVLHVQGPKSEVEKEATLTFLDSCRTIKAPEGGNPDAVAPAPEANPPQASGKTKILGGAFDPEFVDQAPEGAILVGLEIGLGKFFNNDVVRAGRPIYRLGEKESFGEQRGAAIDNTVKVVAKPGYAVGAVTIKAGLTVDGFSITFMKVVEGKLDPADSYESEWIGGPGGGAPVKLTGHGAPVKGVIGKINKKMELTGLGLLLKD